MKNTNPTNTNAKRGRPKGTVNYEPLYERIEAILFGDTTSCLFLCPFKTKMFGADEKVHVFDCIDVEVGLSDGTYREEKEDIVCEVILTADFFKIFQVTDQELFKYLVSGRFYTTKLKNGVEVKEYLNRRNNVWSVSALLPKN